MNRRSEAKENNRVSNAVVGLLVLISLALFAGSIKADEVFKFKNPSFSGIGTGAHYLTIERTNDSEIGEMSKPSMGINNATLRSALVHPS